MICSDLDIPGPGEASKEARGEKWRSVVLKWLNWHPVPEEVPRGQVRLKRGQNLLTWPFCAAQLMVCSQSLQFRGRDFRPS